MNDELTPIGLDEAFQFECHSKVRCFNECCRDLNQFLTPYDILRLKTHLQMTSTAFLEKYTRHHSGPETGLPVITLKPAELQDRRCPFVTSQGCSVYADRPASCRIYPLARMISRSRETGRITEYYAVLREPHCCGFETGKSQTVSEWVVSQGLAVYNEMNDMMMEIISLKNQIKSGPLDVKDAHLFHMVLYDLDRFRSNIKDQNLLADQGVSPEEMDHLLTDDTALLRFGMAWIRQRLFGR